MLNGTLKPYLAYSAAGHAALVLFLGVYLAMHSSLTPKQVYRIDFIGSTATILNRDMEAASSKRAAPAPGKTSRPRPLVNKDDFRVKNRRVVLPKPSFLSEPAAQPEEKTPAPEEKTPAPAEPESAPAPGSGDEQAGAPSASVSADMADFPYPWYLTRLRGALWDHWSARMPGGSGECAVTFTILRDGRSVDIRVESTSGDSSFDYAALSAVHDSAPYPPLPRGFADSFLKVHVQFKR